MGFPAIQIDGGWSVGGDQAIMGRALKLDFFISGHIPPGSDFFFFGLSGGAASACAMIAAPFAEVGPGFVCKASHGACQQRVIFHG